MNGVFPFLLAISDAPIQDLSMFNPASPQAGAISNLSVLVFAITGFIFVVVEGILFYSLIRFRRRAATSSAEPPQVYGSKPIEIAWTAAPGLVIFVLVLVTARTLWYVNEPAPQPQPGDKALFVTVVGHQWWWEYTYTSYDGRKLAFTTANELHVPAGGDGVERKIYLTLKSADVCHSFWVPRLAGKTDLIPGRDNAMWFQSDQPGLYLGQCAEYCGTQHAHMLLRVVVDSPSDFDKWLENQEKPADLDKALANESKPTVEQTDARKGQALFCAQACAQCHRISGTSARGTMAPDLTHLMSRQTLASGMIPNTPENLRNWVDDPQNIKQGCLMPGFGNLANRNRDDIIAYLLTLH
jgi:cytochrome c oxidase subunit II